MQQQQQQHPEDQGFDHEATMEILLGVRKIWEDESRADLLLRLLDRRGLVVDEATRERVRTCQDRGRLELWFDRAAVASRVDEVFAD